MMKNLVKQFCVSALVCANTMTFAGANEDLIAACSNGDLNGAKSAINAGADVNALAPDNNSAISKAFFWPEITKLLIENGADPNGGSYPAIINAANNYSLEVMDLLIAAGADVNKPGYVKNESTEKIKKMIEDMEVQAAKAKGKSKKIYQTGIDQLRAQYPDLDGPGLKFYAIQNVLMQTNCIPCLQKLLDNKADLTLGVENNMNQIHTWAVYSMTAEQRKEAFAKGKTVMEERFNFKSPDWYGKLPSSINGSPEGMLDLLLKAGEDINKLDVNQRSPLHHAMAGGVGNKSHVLMALVKNGADITIEDPLFGKPFTLAVKTGEIELVQFFLDNGADINETSKIIDMNIGQRLNGASPLIAAAMKDNLEMVKFLVQKGAKVKQGCYGLSANMKTGCMTSVRGKTAVYFAIDNQNIEVIEYLIKDAGIKFQKKIVIDQWKKTNETQMGNYTITTTSCYSDGEYSPYTYAKKAGYSDIVKFMKENGLK